jgi:hypothetical protein
VIAAFACALSKRNALYGNTTGSGNIAIGKQAGVNLTTEGNNIDIGNVGVAGDAAKIREWHQGRSDD